MFGAKGIEIEDFRHKDFSVSKIVNIFARNFQKSPNFANFKNVQSLGNWSFRHSFQKVKLLKKIKFWVYAQNFLTTKSSKCLRLKYIIGFIHKIFKSLNLQNV